MLNKYISKIEKLISYLDSFPVSYNQMFLKGSLRYCWRAIKRLNKKKHTLLMDLITSYYDSIISIDLIFNDISKYKLNTINKNFYQIQKICVKEKLLPMLDNMTVNEAMKDQEKEEE